MSIVDIRHSHPIFAAFLLLLSLSASAQDWQRVVNEKICTQWQGISGDQYQCEVSFPALSGNFNLPACTEDWQLALLRPLQPGRNGLEISCNNPWWKQNVALQLHAYAQVAVLTQPVSIGQVLSAADISMVRHDIGTISKEFFTDANAVIGQQIRRQLRAGTILNADMLNNPIVINRGEQVVIRTQKPGLSIEVKGIALEQGRSGERIRVRNERSGTIVTGSVIAAGLVLVQ